MRTLLIAVAAVLLFGALVVATPDAAVAGDYGYYGYSSYPSSAFRGSSGYYSHSCDLYGNCRTSYTPTRRFNYGGFNSYDYRPLYPRSYNYRYNRGYRSGYGGCRY